jgi:hypothetical protein
MRSVRKTAETTKHEIFYKTPIPSHDKSQDFEQTQITRKHVELDAYCKIRTYL